MLTSPLMYQRSGGPASGRASCSLEKRSSFAFLGARDHFAILQRSVRAAGLLGAACMARELLVAAG
jgi:hypothetical protein